METPKEFNRLQKEKGEELFKIKEKYNKLMKKAISKKFPLAKTVTYRRGILDKPVFKGIIKGVLLDTYSFSILVMNTKTGKTYPVDPAKIIEVV